MAKFICGIDEAGRGALAGPIVAAGVVLPDNFDFHSLSVSLVVRDSKLLSVRQRMKVFELILKHAKQFATTQISAVDINQKGINWANQEAFRRLILRLDAQEYICDGILKLNNVRKRKKDVRSMIRADEEVTSVLAAGIVAKVKRDFIMEKLHSEFPYYGWKTNTGHATMQHLEAIIRYGITPFHRRQFVSTALGNDLPPIA